MSASSSSIVRPATIPRWNAAANRTLVAAYKLVGFLLLTIILIGIASFVALHTFYVVHRAWVVPRVVAPGDPEVLEMRSRLAEEVARHLALVGERRSIESKLKRLRLVAEAEQVFQESLPGAMQSDADSRRANLAALTAAREAQRQVRNDLARLGKTLQQTSREQLEKDFAAKLITEQELLEQTYQLSRLAQEGPSLMEREAELGERIRKLSREAQAFEAAGAAHAGAGAAGKLGYEGVMMRRELARSRAEGLGATTEIELLEQARADIGKTIDEHEGLINMLRGDPLLQASERRMHLAFLAYGGQSSVQEGAQLYACRLALVLCQPVGVVKRYLPGERTQDHPVYGKELRGHWVEIEVDDPVFAAGSVLHANRPPLFF